jgi:hypothetical protein
MALPDISNLSLTELEELIQLASLRYHSAEADHAAADLANKVKITSAIASLTALLGPEGTPANTNNINGVLAFTDAQMAANAGLAFRLAFTGLKELTKTTLDLAKVVGS